MKINAKMTKADMVSELNKMADSVAYGMKNTISYVVELFEKDPKKVKKADLLSIFKNIELEAQPVASKKTVAVKTSESKEAAKPATRKTKTTVTKAKVKTDKKDEKKDEKKATEKPKTAPKSEKKATVKKKTAKKADKKSKKSKKNNKTEILGAQSQKDFPESFKIEDVGTAKKRLDIQSMEQIMKILEKDERLFVMFYWTPELLAANPYADIPEANKVKSFPKNLDVCEVFYVADNLSLLHSVSHYTEAVHSVWSEEIAPAIEADLDIRVSFASGEFEFYSIED